MGTTWAQHGQYMGITWANAHIDTVHSSFNTHLFPIYQTRKYVKNFIGENSPKLCKKIRIKNLTKNAVLKYFDQNYILGV